MSFAVGLLINVIINLISNTLILIHKKVSFWIPIFDYRKEHISELFSFGGYFQIGKLANIVTLNTDNILIASFLGATFVSSYAF